MASPRGTIDKGVDDALDAIVRLWLWWRGAFASFFPLDIGQRIAPVSRVPLELSAGMVSGEMDSTAIAANNKATIGTIPESDLFRIRKTFPVAVRKNLRQAISLQIEQLVPLQRDEIHFGYRILADKKLSDEIEVEIVIVEKARLDRMTEWSLENDIPLETIQAAAKDGADKEVVFWESELLEKKRNARRMNCLLVILLVIFSVSAISAVDTRWRESEEIWSQLVHKEQVRAAGARALQDEIETIQAKDTKRSELRTAQDVRRALAIVSEVLPDGTHALQLMISGDTFDLDVVSEDVAVLEAAVAADERLSDVVVEATEGGEIEASNGVMRTAKVRGVFRR